jgi:hypothetical protein
MSKVLWEDLPEDHDYPSALSYLTLISSNEVADSIIRRLRATPIDHFKAKDIVRAAQIPLLPKSNYHVHKNLRRIEKQKPRSPIILVRGNGYEGVPLTIADGYHRACAVYWSDEDAYINVKIVDWK